FVLNKALSRGLRPLVVLNKVDRPSRRPDDVDTQLLELFLDVEASDAQMDYRTLLCSAKQGFATTELDEVDAIVSGAQRGTMRPLLDAIIDEFEPPAVDTGAPFRMLVTQVGVEPFVGRTYLGRIASGTISVGQPVTFLHPPAAELPTGRVTKLVLRRGLEQVPLETAVAGDIITLSGLTLPQVNSTLCAPGVAEPLPFIPLDQPTVSMTFSANTSPLAGQEGKLLTSQVIRERLLKELETNIALRIYALPSNKDFEVCGRGELQLGILIETMRREGFELSISPPKVVVKRDPVTNQLVEPVEDVVIDVDEAYQGTVIEKMSVRKAQIEDVAEVSGKIRLRMIVPTRGLLGFEAEFKNDTKGTGVLNHAFRCWEGYKGAIPKTRKGALVSTAAGTTTTYALEAAQARGRLFVGAGTPVYEGMVIGEYAKDVSDLNLNPAKTKAVTNVRSALKEDITRLANVIPMTLEETLAYMAADEVMEVTPKSIRLRKAVLSQDERHSLRRRAIKGGQL
ncbi:hypothetical protein CAUPRSCDRAFT_7227, partial [Caulochytrium protostelioides]